MKIYLVRHGESTGDVEERYGGSYDDHLTRAGRDQAKELAVKLADKNIEIIFSSPLFRAKETGEIIQQLVGCETNIISDLRERNRYGFITGMKKGLARIKYQNEVEMLKSYEYCIEGGETYGEFKNRIEIALDELTSSKFNSIAIVTHGGPISCIFRSLGWGEFSQLGHCAVFEVEKEKGKFKLLHVENAELEK